MTRESVNSHMTAPNANTASQSPPTGVSTPDANAGLSAPAFSPLYQQIKGLILQSLQSGEWKPGEAIPSEMELAARYRVSQGTVRKAIDELATIIGHDVAMPLLEEEIARQQAARREAEAERDELLAQMEALMKEDLE